jgi:hypothetical protein
MPEPPWLRSRVRSKEGPVQRLKEARRFATAFHGLVCSFARLSQESAEHAALAALSKPARLADLDNSNLDRLITVSNRMMGAVPWRGGTLGLALGLFSVT